MGGDGGDQGNRGKKGRVLFILVLGVSALSLLVWNKSARDRGDRGAEKPGRAVLFRVALVSDSHNDNVSLGRALELAESKGVAFVIHLGDYSDLGTVEELTEARRVLDASGVPYYAVLGDHDLWDSRNRGWPGFSNFEQVFGPAYQSFEYQGVKFVLLNNADEQIGIDQPQWEWLGEELLSAAKRNQPVFVMTALPPSHPTSPRVMGEYSEEVSEQAAHLLEVCLEYGIRAVFAGETHFFGEFKDEATGLPVVTVGALTTERNFQDPCLVILTVYAGGGYDVENLEL